MKPSRPWLMPISGVPWRATCRAIPSMVPSPPRTITTSQSPPIAEAASAGQASMPVLRAVSPSIETRTPRATRKRAIDSSSSRMPPDWNLPTSAACRKRVDMRGITPQRPFLPQAKMASPDLSHTMLDERAKTLLKALVERYIADGQPVGSRTLSRASGLELSPATIRNVMADLEELGLIASPHTSAGRISTARGYRLFADTMLTVRQGQFAAHSLAPDQPQKVISNAANLLSSLS